MTKEKLNVGACIAIDLGTTNSAVAVYEAGEYKIIPNAEGKNTTPSIVSYTDKGEILVGEAAKRQAITNPLSTIDSIKRIMGMMFDEPKAKEADKKTQYKIVNKDGMAAVSIKDKVYTPQEISAKILTKLKEDAEAYIGSTVTDAVITVPAYFNDSQRKATQEAGTIAGLNVLRIINEPTAAALAYGIDKKGEENIVVFDMGGGTHDVSILEIGDGTFEVLSTDGNAFLGGKDFDQKIVDYLADEFKQGQGVDLRNDAMAMQRLMDSAENAKKELSSTSETEINLPFITMTDAGPQHLVTKITKSKFEGMIESLVLESIKHISTALKDAELTISDINEIVMVGGSTRIPLVKDKVIEYFNNKTLNNSVNPDEVVAAGAAIQAGVLTGDVKDVLLLDVTPLTVGIETVGGIMTKMIKKGTTIPVSKSEIFSTAVDNQPAVSIVVGQGEREFLSDNKVLGTFNLDGIPPAQKGIPQIEVTFDIDANGVLTVKSKDKGSGKEQSITISGSSGLSEDEITQMIQDAEKHKVEDSKRKEIVDARNMLDSVIVQAKKTNDEEKDETLSKVIEKAENVVKNEQSTKEMFDTEKTELEQVLMTIMQNKAQSQTDTVTEHTENIDDTEIIDAEIE